MSVTFGFLGEGVRLPQLAHLRQEASRDLLSARRRDRRGRHIHAGPHRPGPTPRPKCVFGRKILVALTPCSPACCGCAHQSVSNTLTLVQTGHEQRSDAFAHQTPQQPPSGAQRARGPARRSPRGFPSSRTSTTARRASACRSARASARSTSSCSRRTRGRSRSSPPPSRTKWTRRVPHPVLIGHAASLSQPSSDPLEAVDTHGYIEHAPQDQRAAQRAWLV